eukprot:GHVT01086148.1.p1 GENE.GHVT01086148.1~~GHVT01086148.1.p1  ORF type:complete len:114 (+),score=11.81 GHVT01086148.1:183-524(+)
MSRNCSKHFDSKIAGHSFLLLVVLAFTSFATWVYSFSPRRFLPPWFVAASPPPIAQKFSVGQEQSRRAHGWLHVLSNLILSPSYPPGSNEASRLYSAQAAYSKRGNARHKPPD